MNTAEYPFVEPVRYWPKMKNRKHGQARPSRPRRSPNLISVARACSSGLSDLSGVAWWAVDRPVQQLLEGIGVEQQLRVSVSPRVGADVGDDERRVRVERQLRQSRALRAARRRDLGQVRRIPITFGAQRETGRYVDARFRQRLRRGQRSTMPPKAQVSAWWYSLVRSVVGTSRCITSSALGGWRPARRCRCRPTRSR